MFLQEELLYLLSSGFYSSLSFFRNSFYVNAHEIQGDGLGTGVGVASGVDVGSGGCVG